jgi:hypothetical protein
MSLEGQDLDIARLHPRLGDGLAAADGECRVFVGAVLDALGHEPMPRHEADGTEDTEVVNALRLQGLHQARAIALVAVTGAQPSSDHPLTVSIRP